MPLDPRIRLTPSVLFGALSSACALQLGGGVDGTRAEEVKVRNVVSVGAQLQADRKASSLASARLNMTAGLDDRPILLKSVILGVGVRLPARSPPPAAFGFEAALEGGAGAPSTQRFDRVGAYLGGRGGLLYRLVGAADIGDGYSLAYYGLDLVLSVRGGTWGVPEGTSPYATRVEVGTDLALRINLGSDLITGNTREKAR